MWIPDTAVSACMVCTDPFTKIRRRHHCRMCGHVICGPCSTHKLKIPYMKDTQGRVLAGRVCDECYSREQSGGMGNIVSTRKKKQQKSVKNGSVLDVAASGIRSRSDVVMSGFLQQRLPGILRSSKRLWFVLKKNYVLYS